jgi:hypothetical protein
LSVLHRFTRDNIGDHVQDTIREQRRRRIGASANFERSIVANSDGGFVVMATVHDRITAWLIAEGFDSGWVLSGTTITLWERDEPQPEIPADLLEDE